MKMILVPLRGDGGDAALLDATFDVARRFNSHVEVLHVRPDPAEFLRATSMAFPGALRTSVVELGQKQAEETAQQARASFEAYCASEGIKVLDKPPYDEGVTCAWVEATGKESLAVAMRGRLNDLTVLARPLEETPAPETLEAALMHSGKPLLVLPPDKPDNIGRRVAIGWNGSAVAAKAVTAARHFMITADKVTVLSRGAAKQGRLTVEDLVDHLAWHDVQAETHEVPDKAGGSGAAILAEARKLDCDLLVLGGYGTSMTRELMLGGVTRHMLAHAEIPLLMAH